MILMVAKVHGKHQRILITAPRYNVSTKLKNTRKRTLRYKHLRFTVDKDRDISAVVETPMNILYEVNLKTTVDTLIAQTPN